MKKIFSILFVFFILVFSVRGNYGNPDINDLSQNEWMKNGPFELSPERGRFALTYTITENRNLYFPVNLAEFVLPDLTYRNGNYVSLFAPGVSFIVIPGYLIGKILNIAQVGTYFIISIFALSNFILIYSIAKKLGASEVSGILSALIFIFATPSFSYATTLYQHHITTFLLLFCLYLQFRFKSFFSHFITWILIASSFIVDYPNILLTFPLGVYSLTRIIRKRINGSEVKFRIDLRKLAAVAAAGIPLTLLLMYNRAAFNSPYQLSVAIPAVKSINDDGSPLFYGQSLNEDSFVRPSTNYFFKTRSIINGLYVHIVSPERGMVFFAPVVLLGTAGVSVLYKKKQGKTALLVSIAAINIVMYSMWEDPWGGWAFGSRYLIPTYAVLSLFLSLAIDYFGRRNIFRLVFLFLLNYSLFVNILGGLTTSAIPPKAEAQALSNLFGQEQKYSIDKNWNYLTQKGSKSFVYNQLFSKILSPQQYFVFIFILTSGFMGCLSLSALKMINYYFPFPQGKNENFRNINFTALFRNQ